jgi:hypothetical protein
MDIISFDVFSTILVIPIHFPVEQSVQRARKEHEQAEREDQAKHRNAGVLGQNRDP